MAEVKLRLGDLEREFEEVQKNSKNTNTSASSSTGNGLARELSTMQNFVNSLDPALRRVALIGFSESLSAGERVQKITVAMRSKHADAHFTSVGNFYSGPPHDQKLTKVSFVEFAVSHSMRFFLSKFGDDRKFILEDHTALSCKAARTKINNQRNHSLRKAEELLKASPLNVGKIAKIEWKDRKVIVGGADAFLQDKGETRGHFCAAFSSLSLP